MSAININTKLRIKFYDDRNRGYDCFMDKILFENDDVCLCVSNDYEECRKEKHGIILFDKKTGEVLTTDLDRYYAINY